ncbi:hypothetical protein [Halodesulfovibrio sp.]|jgi:His-Xaa-Ser system protein HxsD|uniref:hypothetical protein n=1 Tax=Halodesulfovibrio sp. TaxID=1912772 RepID=UPI0026001CB4|nr:hypothetical protein [Halodesulfovibrio sp.]MCT4625681.1 hypothetical protein [Halodesulfovibrio sp.]
MAELSISFDKASFNLLAVQRAAYDNKNTVGCAISQTENKIVITLTSSNNSPKELEEKLRASVLDHQLRLSLEKDFSTIRTLLVSKAIESSVDLTTLGNEENCV